MSMRSKEEMINMKEIEQTWTDLVSESLVQKGGELNLIYEPGNVELELVSGDGRTIPISVVPDGSLVLNLGNHGVVQVTMENFFEAVIEDLNAKFNYQLDVEDYQRDNLLKNLLLLKQSLQRLNPDIK